MYQWEAVLLSSQVETSPMCNHLLFRKQKGALLASVQSMLTICGMQVTVPAVTNSAECMTWSSNSGLADKLTRQR